MDIIEQISWYLDSWLRSVSLRDKMTKCEALRHISHRGGKIFKFLDSEYRSDKEIIYSATRYYDDSDAINHIGEDLKHDKDFLSTVIARNPGNLLYATSDIRSDRELILKAIQKNPEVYHKYRYLSPRDEDFILDSIKNNGIVLKYVDDKLRNNANIVLEAVKNDGMALEYASRELKNNYNIVFEAVKNDGMALEYASEELKNNYNIVFEAVKTNGFLLRHVSEEFKNNYNIVFEAVKSDGIALKYASEELRNNYNIVFEAVKNDGMVLEYASNKLQANEEILSTAFKSDFRILSSNEININFQQILTPSLYQEYKVLLDQHSDIFKSGAQIRMEMLKEAPWAVYFLENEFRDSKSFTIDISKEDGKMLCASKYRNDIEVVFTVAQHNAVWAIQCRHPEMDRKYLPMIGCVADDFKNWDDDFRSCEEIRGILEEYNISPPTPPTPDC